MSSLKSWILPATKWEWYLLTAFRGSIRNRSDKEFSHLWLFACTEPCSFFTWPIHSYAHLFFGSFQRYLVGFQSCCLPRSSPKGLNRYTGNDSLYSSPVL